MRRERRAFTLVESPSASVRERAAFTLVELLVVIAIIIALLAILMPSLGRATEIAQRAVCASQISELSSATLVYAADYQGRVPIGHANDKYQFNYLIWRNDGVQGFWAFGLLYKAGILTDPAVHYCPSTPMNNFDTAANPWFNRQPVSTTSVHTRSDFGMRPVVNWESISGKIQPDGPFPSIQSLGNVAIYADRFTSVDEVDRRHGDGLNAGGLDGGVGWVDRRDFQDALDQFANVFEVVNNGPQMQVWKALDRRR